MSSTQHREQRPPTVTLAVLLAAVSLTLGFVKQVAGGPLPAVYLFLGPIFAIQFGVIYCVFFGKKWARWLFLFMVFLVFCHLVRALDRDRWLLTPEASFNLVRIALTFIAAALLLLPSSAGWFWRTKE